MNVPLLDLKPQAKLFREEILGKVSDIIDSTQYIMGSEVDGFEKSAADYCGTDFGIGVSSGTDALLNCLMSLDIGPGDMVLTTPYTFFATMGVILRVGAKPVFVDIEPDSLNLDPVKAAEVLEQDRQGTNAIKAIMPVHLFGQCADMAALSDLAVKYQLPVIEDAAQAIGAEYPFKDETGINWKRAGSLGSAGCFSFFPSKNLGCMGDGGLVTTNDPAYAEILRSNRNHGAEPKYYHSRVGGNFRLDPIQAAILSIKLPYLENWHAGRRENAAMYRQLFQDTGLVNDAVTLPTAVYEQVEGAAAHNHHIYNQFTIHVSQRDALREHLHKNSIGCEIYYPLCLHQQACIQGNGYDKQSFPVAEQAAQTALSLPIYPELTQDQLTYVVSTIKDFFASSVSG